MTRVELIKNLSTIAPTYSIGQNGNSEDEYIVVKACTGYGAGSRAGFIQPYELKDEVTLFYVKELVNGRSRMQLEAVQLLYS